MNGSKENGRIKFEQVASLVAENPLEFPDTQLVRVSTFFIEYDNKRDFVVLGLPVASPPFDADKEMLRVQGLIQKQLPETLDYELIPGDLEYSFFKKIYKNASYSVRGFLQYQEIMISYFCNVEPLKFESLEKHDEHYLVPIEEWQSQIELNFNFYLWFHKNQRQILFVKKGESLSKRNFERLKNSTEHCLAISSEEMESYETLKILGSLSEIKRSV